MAVESGGFEQSAEEVRHRVHDFSEKATRHGKSVLEEQKHTAASQLDGVAEALRHAADQLSSDGQETIADLAGRAASGLGGFASKLREKDVDSLVDEVEHFARSKPAMFIGGAVAAGFLLSRFLKSRSSDEGV